ncbi:uncharacterized protein DNG_07504 [Cephalotrichum gorgonifer]|uniref:Uncharacterized protein n=1 Tax=Cephalotrichum gorgonifer TaxID=2041049 RepID=A0AAE8N3G0_9PEZI|nr:uncharacterized protein DNG_07504 [Cephalotrichum gorgonifer]
MTPVGDPKNKNPPSDETSLSLPPSPPGLPASRAGNAAPRPWDSASTTEDHRAPIGKAAPSMGHAIHKAREPTPISSNTAHVAGDAASVPGGLNPHDPQPGNHALHRGACWAWSKDIDDTAAHCPVQFQGINFLPLAATLSSTSSLRVELEVDNTAPPSAGTPQPAQDLVNDFAPRLWVHRTPPKISMRFFSVRREPPTQLSAVPMGCQLRISIRVKL